MDQVDVALFPKVVMVNVYWDCYAALKVLVAVGCDHPAEVLQLRRNGGFLSSRTSRSAHCRVSLNKDMVPGGKRVEEIE